MKTWMSVGIVFTVLFLPFALVVLLSELQPTPIAVSADKRVATMVTPSETTQTLAAVPTNKKTSQESKSSDKKDDSESKGIGSPLMCLMIVVTVIVIILACLLSYRHALERNGGNDYDYTPEKLFATLLQQRWKMLLLIFVALVGCCYVLIRNSDKIQAWWEADPSLPKAEKEVAEINKTTPATNGIPEVPHEDMTTESASVSVISVTVPAGEEWTEVIIPWKGPYRVGCRGSIWTKGSRGGPVLADAKTNPGGVNFNSLVGPDDKLWFKSPDEESRLVRLKQGE